MISFLTASISVGLAKAQAQPNIAVQPNNAGQIQPQFAPGVQLVNQVGAAQQPFVDQSLLASAQPVNFVPASPQGNQFQAYDTAYLASLNGRLPEWNPNFPVVENGYLVPILVDEEEAANLDPAYQWIDPSTQPVSWTYAQYPPGPDPGTVAADGVNGNEAAGVTDANAFAGTDSQQ